jgi:hypothetical protein
VLFLSSRRPPAHQNTLEGPIVPSYPCIAHSPG